MSRLTMPREAYVPSRVESRRTQFPDAALEVVEYEQAGRWYALGWHGKAQKPTFHFAFRTAERRAEYIAAQVAGGTVNVATRAQRATERKAFRHSLKVGDVLHTSWGYDQTNVEFFEVVEVCGADVVVRELAQNSTQTGFLQGRCSPRPGEYCGPPIRKRVCKGNSLKMSDWGRYAWLGGGEHHWSSYA